MPTELLYLRDAYLTGFSGNVIGVRHDEIALDCTAFYPTGGGQPHDVGRLSGMSVVGVSREGDLVWHKVQGGPRPALGETLTGTVEWVRRHRLMRTHTALHVLCGIIWNEWQVAVTGGNMEPLVARMDFEFDPLPADFASIVEGLVNAEIALDRPIDVSFLPRGTAFTDHSLIRTKANLVPEDVETIRVVDIRGLDRQADGGTHVRSTREIGRVEVMKTENKGKGNKRIRIQVVDA